MGAAAVYLQQKAPYSEWRHGLHPCLLLLLFAIAMTCGSFLHSILSISLPLMRRSHAHAYMHAVWLLFGLRVIRASLHIFFGFVSVQLHWNRTLMDFRCGRCASATFK